MADWAYFINYALLKFKTLITHALWINNKPAIGIIWLGLWSFITTGVSFLWLCPSVLSVIIMSDHLSAQVSYSVVHFLQNYCSVLCCCLGC